LRPSDLQSLGRDRKPQAASCRKASGSARGLGVGVTVTAVND
jgi:hypothetical protein